MNNRPNYEFCADCGDPRGVCRCEDTEYRMQQAADYDEDDEPIYDDDPGLHICPRCNGTGIYIDDITPCDHCDGLGYEWWLP